MAGRATIDRRASSSPETMNLPRRLPSAAGSRRLGPVLIAVLIAATLIVGPDIGIAEAREMTTESVGITPIPLVEAAADDLPIADGQVIHRAIDASVVMVGVSHAGGAGADQGHDDHPAQAAYWIRSMHDGVWSAWTPVDRMEDGPDQPTSTRPASHPVWVDGASEVQLVIPADAHAPELHLVRETSTSITLTGSTPSAEAATGGPAIRLRSEWGARTAASPARTAPSGVQFAVVHHTGSTAHNSYSAGEVPRMLRGIQSYHMDARDWNDIGYNFVVDRFGRIWEGRGGGIELPVIGAHAGGFNTGSVGIALLGHFDTATPTSAARSAIAQVAGWKLAFEGIDPDSTFTYTSGGSPTIPAGNRVKLNRVVGHRDVGSTGCPGGSLYQYVNGLQPPRIALGPDASPAHPAITVGYTGNDYASVEWAAQYWGWTPEEFSRKAALLLGYLSAIEGEDAKRRLDPVPAVDGPYEFVTEFPGSGINVVDIAANHFSINRPEAVRTATYLLVYLSLLENAES
jgi:hypothetical protein